MPVLARKTSTGRGKKVCPECRRIISSQIKTCDCGFVFHARMTLQSQFGLLKTLAGRFTRERPIENTDEFGEACLALARAASKHDGSHAFSTTVWTCVYRHLITYKRKQNRLKRRVPIQHVDLVRCADPLSLDRELLLREILADHPNDSSKMRRDKPLMLRWVCGETCEEIGREIGRSPQAIRKRIARVVCTLQQRYKNG